MRLKIGLLTEKFAPEIGGLARHSERLANLLSRRGMEVVVFTPTPRLPAGETTEETRERTTLVQFGVHKHSTDTLQDWHDLTAAGVRKHQLDLLHALNASYAAYVAVITALSNNIPSVVSVRGADLDSALVDPRRMPLVLWALQRAGAVTAATPDLARRVQAISGRPDVGVAVPSVDPDLFKRLPDAAGIRKKLGLDASRVIGFVGEAKKKKGLVTLLKAFSRVAREEASARLLIVGAVKRDDANLLKMFLKANPAISKNVQLVPWTDTLELVRYYNGMDVLAIPSLRTAGAAPALEAMACEVPVVASDVAGLREIVQNDKTGYLFGTRDDGSMSSAILRILRDPELSRRLGQAGRHAATEDASPGKEAEALEHAYAQVAAGAPK